MSTRYLLLAFMLAPFGATSACATTDPAAVARELFTMHHFFYVADSGDLELLSPKLARVLKRDWECQADGDLCAIGADPWVNAQDGDALPPIDYTTVSSDAATATIAISYRLGWEEKADEAVPQTTRVHLVRSDASGCWLLDDLSVDDASLQATLAEYDD